MVSGKGHDLPICPHTYASTDLLHALSVDASMALVFRWRNCPMEKLPFADHQHYELVEIDLSESKIVQLWDGKKFLNKLEHLNLSCCPRLKQTPDLSGAPNLKTLDLECCRKLSYIHPSLAHHESLIELNLRECRSLETLGDKLEMSSLKKLDLFLCESLRRLPEFGECMKQLSILTMLAFGILKLPKTIVNLVGLSEVDFGHCKFTGVPLSYGCFVGLKKLKSEEPTPHYDLAHLALLTDLNLLSNNFLIVPISIHQLPRLARLQLIRCFKLEVLPKLPSSLRELHALGCNSLDASNVNDAISKACCAFAESSTQDPQDILQMWIGGNEIPAWFDHQEQDNGVSSVSISFPHNFPSTETMALALRCDVNPERNVLDANAVCEAEMQLLRVVVADAPAHAPPPLLTCLLLFCLAYATAL
ncbi:hypothetical protein PIB30_084555 [Stylosanthes scabra]|uniref:Uncharacterized protein n=1 Tax=Stylosanthes scabra TaxID=79078 RepID=A0ABU6TTD1_9FABA|nr:hypothetical protein [Stylosanthes scabra]